MSCVSHASLHSAAFPEQIDVAQALSTSQTARRVKRSLWVSAGLNPFHERDAGTRAGREREGKASTETGVPLPAREELNFLSD